MEMEKNWEFTGYKKPKYWFGDRVYLLNNLSYKGVSGTILGLEWQGENYTDKLTGFWYSVWFENCVSAAKIHEGCLTKTRSKNETK
jgi:hypothetical protein